MALPISQQTRTQLIDLLTRSITDPLNRQNTPARVRQVLRALIDSFFNKADDQLALSDIAGLDAFLALIPQLQQLSHSQNTDLGTNSPTFEIQRLSQNQEQGQQITAVLFGGQQGGARFGLGVRWQNDDNAPAADVVFCASYTGAGTDVWSLLFEGQSVIPYSTRRAFAEEELVSYTLNGQLQFFNPKKALPRPAPEPTGLESDPNWKIASGPGAATTLTATLTYAETQGIGGKKVALPAWKLVRITTRPNAPQNDVFAVFASATATRSIAGLAWQASDPTAMGTYVLAEGEAQDTFTPGTPGGGGPTYTAGTGISISGNVISATGSSTPGPVSWVDIQNKPTSFTPSAHTHAYADITGKPTAFTPSAHTHAIADTTGLQAALDAKAAASHTHTSANISDFTEAVQDAVAALLGAGTNVTLTYNDAANTLTVAAAGGSGGGLDAEAVRDAIGVALVGVGNISVVVNDAADTITISTTATQNSTDAQLRDRATHTGTQAISTVSGLQAALDAKATNARVLTVENDLNDAETELVDHDNRLTALEEAPPPQPSVELGDGTTGVLQGEDGTLGFIRVDAQGNYVSALMTVDNGALRLPNYGQAFQMLPPTSGNPVILSASNAGELLVNGQPVGDLTADQLASFPSGASAADPLAKLSDVPDAIPLAGTEVGNPITGPLALYDGANDANVMIAASDGLYFRILDAAGAELASYAYSNTGFAFRIGSGTDVTELALSKDGGLQLNGQPVGSGGPVVKHHAVLETTPSQQNILADNDWRAIPFSVSPSNNAGADMISGSEFAPRRASVALVRATLVFADCVLNKGYYCVIEQVKAGGQVNQLSAAYVVATDSGYGVASVVGVVNAELGDHIRARVYVPTTIRLLGGSAANISSFSYTEL